MVQVVVGPAVKWVDEPETVLLVGLVAAGSETVVDEPRNKIMSQFIPVIVLALYQQNVWPHLGGN